MNLLTAYRFHRWQSVGARYPRKEGPNPAADALAAARADMAAIEAAKAAGDTKEVLRHVRYDRSPPCISYQARDTSSPARSRERLAHVESPAAFGLRLVGRVSCQSGGMWSKDGRDGWLTDPFGDVARDGTGLCYGVVYQVPGRHGRARFIAGFEFGGFDGGPTLDLGNVYESESADQGDYWNVNPQDHEDAQVAARVADSMARHAAEQERDYQTAWQIGRAYADAGEEIADARRETLEAIAQFKAARVALSKGEPMPGNPDGATLESRFGRLCALIRSDVGDALERIRDARELRRKALKGDGPHDLCVYMGDTERAAFCDAAGLESFPA